jgi:uncharacterized protein (TIGR00269 family)
VNSANKQASKKDIEFMKCFEAEVRKTIRDHKMLKKGERVLVACSGGKDSTVILYLLKKFGYEPEAFIIDLEIGDYSKKNLKNIKQVCKDIGVKLHVVDFKKEFGRSVCYMRSVLNESDKLQSCTVCGIMKRYLLNKKSRQFKADKLVVGHNLDDEAQTIIMNLLISGGPELCLNMGPMVGKRANHLFVPRVKPLYFTFEADVRRYSELKCFPVVYDRCPCAIGSHRFATRDLLDKWESERPGTKRKLVINFLDVLPGLRSHLGKGGPIRKCKKCGEPSRQGVCASCELIGKI